MNSIFNITSTVPAKGSWYTRIVKTAAAKDKVAKLKITDPILEYFVYRYDNAKTTINGKLAPLVDWNKVKTQDDLSDYISGIYANLKSKMDPDNPDNYYVKDIDMTIFVRNQANNPDPEIQKAIKMFYDEPDEAKKIVLNKFNENKL